MKRAGLLVATAAAILTASCTAGVPSAGRPSTRPPAASSPADLAAPASCPVTRPLQHAVPPLQLRAIDNFTYYLHGWYGNTALWVGVPVLGILPAGAPLRDAMGGQ